MSSRRRVMPEVSSTECFPHISGAKTVEYMYWPLILTKDDIPEWLEDNAFIIQGHPMPTNSYERSLRLLYCVHMESMNIWTHLIGSILFVTTGVMFYGHVASSSLKVNAGDVYAFGISITTASVCFAFSSVFHTLRSHSYNIHHLWGTLDIFGVCLFALGGGTSAAYYVLYCSPKARGLYYILTASAVLVVGATLFDTGGGGSRKRRLRGSLFALLVSISMLPVLGTVKLIGWNQACTQFGVQWYTGEALTLFIGGFLFVTRLPERLSPGRFDILGHSHQLHHLCALLAASFHIVALVAGYRYRQAHPVCASY